MKFAPMTLAASFVIAPAAFSASFAESPVVSEQGFDWIFFAIVCIPFILALVEVFKPDWLERIIRDRNAPGGWDSGRNSMLERRDRTGAL